MDLIIVAIDFSKTSMHALEYSLNIANRANADVMMVWVDNQTSSESVFSDGGAELRDEAKSNFEEIISDYKPQLVKGKLTYKLRKGKVYFEVAQQARQNKASLVVAGTHGVTGYEEFWIGSNAYRIVSSAPCPVITLSNQFQFSKEITKIVLPIDNTKNTYQKASTAIDIARLFGAEIHVVSLYSTNIPTLRNKVNKVAEKVITNVKESGIKCISDSFMTENPTRLTLKYADDISAELIVIMTEQETTASNILLGEFAQQMVNNSPVPVLSVHPEEISG